MSDFYFLLFYYFFHCLKQAVGMVSGLEKCGETRGETQEANRCKSSLYRVSIRDTDAAHWLDRVIRVLLFGNFFFLLKLIIFVINIEIKL